MKTNIIRPRIFMHLGIILKCKIVQINVKKYTCGAFYSVKQFHFF